MPHLFQPETADESRRSGLTGSADIPESSSNPARGLSHGLGAIRRGASGTVAGLPRVLRLVWGASPAMTIALGAVTLLSAVTPAATAYMGKLLVNAVLHAIHVHADHLPDRTTLDVPLPFATLHSPPTTSLGVLVMLAAIEFGILTSSSLLSSVRNVTQQLLQEKVALQVQLMVMEHAAGLDLRFFEESASYDLLRRAQQEAAMRPVQMVSGGFGLVQTAITFATMVALLAGVSPLLALLALLSPVPAFIADMRYGWRGYDLAGWASPLRRRMQYLAALVTTDLYAKEVMLYGLSGYFIERFRLLARAYYDRQRRLAGARQVAGFLWSSITTLVGSLTYLYVAVQAVLGALTLGDLTLYTQAVASVQTSIQGLLGGLSGMYENNLYLAKLYELLDTPARIRAPANPLPLPRPLSGVIEFQGVSFAYPRSDVAAVRHLSFRIAAGETIAVVGRNGAGKTTLVKLLCRLYDPDEGRILLDGVDIRQFDPRALRGAVSAMFQDYVTYQATAAENIGLGDLKALDDRAAVRAAAVRGGVHDMIERLPDGYETPLGRWFDGGANLSGGEWQKVALGRAFMRDGSRAPILVLDEPTSAVDARAEFDLFERLRRLGRGRTAIYISHRFSTVRQADRILFLERGELVEEGTHEELMRLAGRYAGLFQLQASAYVGSPPAVGLTGVAE